MIFKKIKKTHVDWRDLQRKGYLRHREIMGKYSVREAVIQRLMMQKNYFRRWMPQEKTA